MQTFAEYYFIQEKFLSDIRRAFTSNIFKKTTHGIDLKKFRKNLILSDIKNFERIKNSMQTEVASVLKRLNKRDKKFNKEDFGRIYVSNIYRGEIDSGIEIIEGNPIATVVYKLNNGGIIIFITTEDNQGYIRRYITVNNRGNSFFRERLGTTLEQIAADSKGREFTKQRGLPIDRELNKIRKELEDETGIDFTDNLTFNVPEVIHKPTEEDNEFGIMDISLENFNTLKNYWGDGKKSSIKKTRNPFLGLFTREIYYNKATGYSGYKYINKNGYTVYLIDTGDDQNAFIGFDSRESYIWAKEIGLLDFWKTKGNIQSSINWNSGTLDKNLE